MLTSEQVRRFVDTGWVVVSDLVGPDTLDAVDAEVDRLMAEAPPPVGQVGQHFYWRTRTDSPVLFSPLDARGRILGTARQLTGGRLEVAFDQAQVALNIPPYRHRPGRPHLDGYAPGRQTPGSFTMLAGLLLTDQLADDCGNLWVWPGTHRAHAAFFAARGPEAFVAAGGSPAIDLPEPTQVHGRRGDVLLAHYLLGHNIGGNYRSHQTRRAVYWRLRAPGHSDRWADCLTDPWHEYPGIRRRLEATPGVSSTQL